MNKLLLTTTLVATLSACSYEPKIVTIIESWYASTVENEHPEEPKETEDEEEKPSDPDSIPVDSDDSSDPSGPDKPDRVKGNNGFGNGDQSAPGGSLNNNNAENAQGNQGRGRNK